MNYAAEIRGDLIFTGFETAVAAPGHPGDHDLNLSSGRIQEIALVTTLALDPEQTTRSEDGSLEHAGLSAIMELTTEDPEGTASSAKPDSPLIIPKCRESL